MTWAKVNDVARQAGAKRVFVLTAGTPQADTVLDLADGELLPWWARVHRTGDGTATETDVLVALRACREAGRGDLMWWGRDLVLLRGGKAARYEMGREEAWVAERQFEDAAVYRLGESPCTLLVTTGEGRRYKVKVLAVGIQGILLEYGAIEGVDKKL